MVVVDSVVYIVIFIRIGIMLMVLISNFNINFMCLCIGEVVIVDVYLFKFGCIFVVVSVEVCVEGSDKIFSYVVVNYLILLEVLL